MDPEASIEGGGSPALGRDRSPGYWGRDSNASWGAVRLQATPRLSVTSGPELGMRSWLLFPLSGLTQSINPHHLWMSLL